MLTLRDLNRATLARQYLLERPKEDVREVLVRGRGAAGAGGVAAATRSFDAVVA
ncbi:MAG TPA: hypothetical protein VFV66_30095 [Nonomuraea sp.]|nr:hypothetical protein [Nonomuraea sp.]